MIEIITNSMGSGDWVVVRNGDTVLYEGHRPSVWDLADIFSALDWETRVVELTDEQMEDGEY